MSYTRGYVFLKKTYTSKTGGKVEFRWEKHENISSKNFEPTKHFKENLSHKFSWKSLFAAPENKPILKILDTSKIALKRPSLNE